MSIRPLLVASLIVVGSCSDAFVATPIVRLDHGPLDAAAWLDTLSTLDTLTVSLRLVDSGGNEVTGPVVTYESATPDILLIGSSPDGARLTAQAPGRGEIIAYVDDERFDVDTLRHTVVVEPLEILWPRDINVENVDTVRVRLSARYGGGPLTWRSSNESVLVVGSLDTTATPLDTVAEIQTIGTGQANVVVVAAGATPAAREIALPVRVNQKWMSVEAGFNHTCALTVGGVPHCWGGNEYGQLGDGSFSRRLRPVQVATSLRFEEIGAGGMASFWRPPQAHSCGRLGPQIFCWGSFESNQLGDDSGPCRDTFNPAVCLKPLAVQAQATGGSVTVGGVHTCALTGGDPPLPTCWGGENEYSGTELIGSGGGFSSAGDAGGEHVCFTAFASFATGTACAGRNDAGQLGDGTTVDQLTGGTGGLVLTPTGDQLEYNDGVGGGGRHSCAVDRLVGGPRALLCWGSNSDGQLGPSGPGPSSNPCPSGACARTPISVPIGVDVAWGGLTLGFAHTCFLSTAGGAHCWGRNTEGQLGDSTTVSRPTPAPAAPGVQFIHLSAGDTHTCGVDHEGSMYCWGNNDDGQLGDGTQTNRSIPVRVLEPRGR